MKKKLFTVLLASALVAGLSGSLMAQAPATPAQAPPATQKAPPPDAQKAPAPATQAAPPPATQPAPAPAAPAVVGMQKIGLLNIQRAIIECNEGKQAADKLTAQFTPKKKDLESKQQEIEKYQSQLRTQEKTLSDDARTSLTRKLETLSKEFTRANDDFNAEAQQAEGQLINEIGSKIMKVVEDYALKNGYTIVVDVSTQQSPFLWWSSTVEITDDIIKLYNAVTPLAPAPAAPATPPAAKPQAVKKP
jgi:outer membrane protein